MRVNAGTMDLVDACRTPIRRLILTAAGELQAAGEQVTAKAIATKLSRPLTNISYHVAELRKAGALVQEGGEQKRGAWQKQYALSEEFQATMTDTVALDQIAELIDGLPGPKTKAIAADEIVQIVRATGRPVEA